MDRAVAATPYVTPRVRGLTDAQGVDLGTVRGAGLGGRIRKQDVRAAAAAAGEAVGITYGPCGIRGTTRKVDRIRQVTATRSRESLQATAQLTQTVEVDAGRIVRLRDRAEKGATLLPFVAIAAVEALGAHPNLNAHFR